MQINVRIPQDELLEIPRAGSDSHFTAWPVEINHWNMKSVRYVYWQDGEMWLGYLEEYPDYMTQGETPAELEENLRDILKELTSGNIPSVRKVAELQIQ